MTSYRRDKALVTICSQPGSLAKNFQNHPSEHQVLLLGRQEEDHIISIEESTLFDLAVQTSNRPKLSAALNIALSASMAITNKSGESGSPCLKPLAWQILRPGMPLRIIRVLAVERSKEIQLIQRREKPMCSSNRNKNDQLTVSNALAMSTFINAHGLLFRCSSLAESCMALKFS